MREGECKNGGVGLEQQNRNSGHVPKHSPEFAPLGSCYDTSLHAISSSSSSSSPSHCCDCESIDQSMELDRLWRIAANIGETHQQVVPITVFVAVLCFCLVVGHLLEENRWVNESITALIIVHTFYLTFLFSQLISYLKVNFNYVVIIWLGMRVWDNNSVDKQREELSHIEIWWRDFLHLSPAAYHFQCGVRILWPSC